ncbi:MAG: porphobilinogen synthase [Ardenticatenales bacterium]|nr:porphobilinogen synthase [Ardenticatenales bacterium]
MTIRKPNIDPSDDSLIEFLTHRPRRLRRLPGLRRLVRETVLTPADFIYPLFVVHGTGIERAIEAMPGQAHRSIDRLPAAIDAVVAAGVPGVILFGLPAAKDAVGTENFAADGIVQQAIRAIKARAPELVVMTDVCLCEYTDHGHCGVLGVDAHGHGPIVLNDATLPVLGRVAVSHAAAGADVVAPSGMMDGMVAAIRGALDDAGHDDVAIVSYAAKYASAFYGPFREAADSTPQFGDRRGYQMDPANRREALREMALDVDEGADVLMVKPALAYLDVIAAARDAFDLPVAAYNVSGEYAMVKAAAARGWLDERASALETLLSIKRAGADMILTYWALEASAWLAEGRGDVG